MTTTTMSSGSAERADRRAAVHRRRADRAGRLPRRLQRPDPRRVRAGSAAVHCLVSSSTGCTCSRRAGPTSSASAGTWKPGAGPAPTIARRLCTIAGFYRYAVEEELLEHSPAVHVRRPRLDYESHAIGLDRNEVGVAARRRRARRPERARADLAAGDQRAADLRSARRRHRRPRPRTRPPHPDRAAQGRQDRHHPARPPHRPRDRPRHR